MIRKKLSAPAAHPRCNAGAAGHGTTGPATVPALHELLSQVDHHPNVEGTLQRESRRGSLMHDPAYI